MDTANPSVHEIPEIFSVTFKLRKKSPVFSGLLNQIEILQENGFHLMFSTDHEGRWFKIECYEKTQQHPTLTVRRMLATIPDMNEKMRISALNFAVTHFSKVSFSISETEPEFTVKVHKPSREIDFKQIIGNCKLLGITVI